MANNISDEFGSKSIKPEFLGGDGGAGKKINESDDVVGSASNKLKSAEQEATKQSQSDGGSELKDREQNPRALYRPGQGAGKAGGSKKMTGKLKKAAPVVLVGGLLIVGAVALMSSPLAMVGHIDFNLMDSLGFSDTAAILNEQGKYITAEALSNGKVASNYASDLAEAGITVGQVTANGDFVRTNNYIADIDSAKDLQIAASGYDYNLVGAEGELAVLYDNKAIKASELVAELDSNPKMYAAYTDALNISARFYYSDAVNEVYKELGLSRGSFLDWESTGNAETDAENFSETISNILANDSDVMMYGCSDEGECREASGGGTSSGGSSDGGSSSSSDDSGATDSGDSSDSKPEVVKPGSNNGNNPTSPYRRTTPSAELKSYIRILNNYGVTMDYGEIVGVESDSDSLVQEVIDRMREEVESIKNESGSDGSSDSSNSNTEKEGSTDESSSGDSSSSGSSSDSGKISNYEKPGAGAGTSLKKDSSAQEIIALLRERIRGSQATDKATKVLNAAISSAEPQQAARSFLAVEEALQRARIEGGGPVNEVMNALTTQNEIKYTDVNTGEEVTSKKSILETPNFVAAVSGGSFSRSEANNFSRDRVLIATNTANTNNLDETSVSSDQTDSNVLMRISSLFGEQPEQDVLNKSASSITMYTTEMDLNRFSSIVGANRIIEGGSYLSNTINQHALGAVPSDSKTVMAYQKEANKAVAKMIEAERATKSPFDISSPYTFLGSIVSGFNKALIGYYGRASNGANVMTLAGATSDLAKKSVSSIFGTATADGSDNDFGTLEGDCTTVTAAANVVGDLYCNSHNTISTKYMSYTKNQFESQFTESLSGGEIVPGSGLDNFIKYGMGRNATVGVKSADVCEAASGGKSLLDRLLDVFGLYNACDTVDNDVATGAKFTLSNDNLDNANNEYYSAYVLYDTVASLINEAESSVSRAQKRHAEERPVDNSPAGKLARTSGLTKAEAMLALEYAEQLNTIANYEPSSRYAFGAPVYDSEIQLSFVDDDKVQENLYCFWCGRFEQSDTRNRTLVV